MKKLTLPATVPVKELAERLSVSGSELIKYLMGNGVMATLNQSVDFDTAALAADHFGFEAESEAAAAGSRAGLDAAAATRSSTSPAPTRRRWRRGRRS